MTEIFAIEGPAALRGDVVVRGAKNSVLKLMAAALLAPGKSLISNVPAIADVRIMCELLRRLGCGIDYDAAAGTVRIDVPDSPGTTADYELVRLMRASISVLGPLVGRMHAAEVAVPGGDAIGSRGLDMHQDGLERMGAEVTLDHGYFVARAPRGLHGAEIALPFPSVGATENLVMAAVLADGVTVVENAAREPEIVDICRMLAEMGAHIDGIGTSRLTVTGVERLRPVAHRCVGDRIVAGTWAFAAAATGGDVTVHGVGTDLLPNVIDKLESAGAVVEEVAGAASQGSATADDPGFRVRRPGTLRPIQVSTLPFPGFPTDLQPFVIALNSLAQGVGMLTENLFEARWRFVDELSRLGAMVAVDGRYAVVTGRERLSGAEVEASDIRAGAGLVLAGIMAYGRTEVSGVDHIDRGYEFFVEKLTALGASITREQKEAPDFL